MNRENPSRLCGDRSVFLADLEAEGEPEREFHEGIAARMPRKNVAAGALIRDEQGRVLFVTPTYKPYLDIPGGLVEDDESPLAACRREVREELGIDLPITRLLLVDWRPAHGVWHDGLQLIFDGGVVTPEVVARMVPADGEIASLCFLRLEEVGSRLRPSLARRIHLAAEAVEAAGHCSYGEFGRAVS